MIGVIIRPKYDLAHIIRQTIAGSKGDLLQAGSAGINLKYKTKYETFLSIIFRIEI